MNGKRLSKMILASALAALVCLSGCGGLPGGGSSSPEEQAIRVSSTEELLDAIAPGAHIVIEPEYYNMSDYMEPVWARQANNWNARHDYARLEDAYDGATVVISGVDGLTIEGGSAKAAATELVVDPRYADVLAFEDCSNVTLANLTLGHTDTGECSGSVVRLEDCRNVTMTNVDLYGCGVVGVEANNTEGLTVRGSILRECSDGPFYLWDCTGEILFEDCRMIDSFGAGSLYDCDAASVAFRRCEFGYYESTFRYYGDDDSIFEDCTWAEDSPYHPEYPDVDPGDDFRSSLELTRFDKDVLADTVWSGFWLSVPEAEVDRELTDAEEDDIVLSLAPDGTGVLTGLFSDPVYFAWEMDPESDYVANLYADEAEIGNVYLYVEADADESPLYLQVAMSEAYVWMLSK